MDQREVAANEEGSSIQDFSLTWFRLQPHAEVAYVGRSRIREDGAKEERNNKREAMMDVPTLKARVESLLEVAKKSSERQPGNQLLQGTITVFSAVYGPESHQVKTLLEGTKSLNDPKSGAIVVQGNIWAIQGSLENLKEELDGGLLGSLQKRMAGDVLTDFIQLAKAVLQEPGDGAKNVAAVLAAAAFEDTIRRMGAQFAGVMGREDLSAVIDALKKAGVLQAPQLGIALSYLNFRNHALHANWDKIDRTSVNSVLGFVEQLLLKHFQ